MATITDSETGSGVLGTGITVNLPTYSAGQSIVLVTSRNNTDGSAHTASSEISTITELSQVGTRRLAVMILEPNGLGQTSFTLTGSNSFWSYWCAAVSDIDDTLYDVVTNSIGNSTTKEIEIPTITLGHIASGSELTLSVGAVNSTGSFTAGSDTLFNTTSGNAAMLVNSHDLTAGDLTLVSDDVDRGLDGTTRSEMGLAVVFQSSTPPVNNLLTNASFENGSTIGTDWVDESNVTGTPTYSLATSNVEDGEKSQRVQYAGVSGDATGKVQFYQAPVNGVSPGEIVQFDVYISGTLTNAYGIIGVEAFESDASYISDVSTSFTTLDGTPTKYTIQYTAPPLTDYLAVFIQFPAFPETGDIDVYFDKASLVNQGIGSKGFFALVQ